MNEPQMFDFGAGPVPAHRHPHGGGWVADTASVDPTVYVGREARVYDHAKVGGRVCIRDHARVFGNASVNEDALIHYHAVVQDFANVCGHARVAGRAKVMGRSWVADDAHITGNAVISGATIIEGATIEDDSIINENVEVCGTAFIGGRSNISGYVKIGDRASMSDAKVTARGQVFTGYSGWYSWTAYRNTDDVWFLQYGCQRHPINRWPHARAARDFKPGHDVITRAIAHMVRAQIRYVEKGIL